MGAISIPKALNKMDGIFGCKVSFEYNQQTKSVDYTFAKKTIVDWVTEIFFNTGKISEENGIVLNALKAIEKDTVGADNGSLKKLVKKYTNDANLVDFKEIRRTLRGVLEMQFPPVISEVGLPKNDYSNRQVRSAEYFKAFYLKNIYKSICAETYEVKIIPEYPFGKVSDVNLEGLALAWIDFSGQSDKQIFFGKNKTSIAKRVDKILEKTPKSDKTRVPSPVGRPKIDGANAEESSKPVYQAKKIKIPIEQARVMNCPVTNIDGDEEDDITEIYTLSEYKNPKGSVKEKPPVQYAAFGTENGIEIEKDDDNLMDDYDAVLKQSVEEKPTVQYSVSGAENEIEIEKNYENWMNIYDAVLKQNDKDEISTKNGTFEIIRDSNEEISEENIRAVCETLKWLTEQDQMPRRITGGTGSSEVRIYLRLFDMDEEVARKVKTILPEVKDNRGMLKQRGPR